MWSTNCRAKDCDASYVGQTKRQLKTRVKEHKSNTKLDSNKPFVISEHIISFNHSIDWENVEILDIEHNYFKTDFGDDDIKEEKMALISKRILSC